MSNDTAAVRLHHADKEDRVEESDHCTIRVTIGEESMSIDNDSWVGFMEFIPFVLDTPAGRSRLSPAAKLGLVRLLQLERWTRGNCWQHIAAAWASTV